MIIKEIESKSVIDEIMTYSKRLNGKRVSRNIYNYIKEIYDTLSISNVMRPEGIYIECDCEEVDKIALDYIRFCSLKDSLYFVAFVGNNVSVECFRKLQKYDGIVEKSFILPYNHINSKVISIFISRYSEALDMLFDVDYALHIINF